MQDTAGAFTNNEDDAVSLWNEIKQNWVDLMTECYLSYFRITFFIYTKIHDVFIRSSFD